LAQESRLCLAIEITDAGKKSTSETLAL